MFMWQSHDSLMIKQEKVLFRESWLRFAKPDYWKYRNESGWEAINVS